MLFLPLIVPVMLAKVLDEKHELFLQVRLPI